MNDRFALQCVISQELKAVMPVAGTSDRAPGAFAESIELGDLPSYTGYKIKKAYAYVFQTWTTMFADLGLAFGQYSVLLLIGLNPGLSQMALAEAVGLDGSTIVPITNRFAKLGWVRRLRRKEDRRVYSLRATPAGLALLEKAHKVLDEHEQNLLAPLTKQERVNLADLLVKVTEGRGESKPAASTATRPARKKRRPSPQK
jgi:MarR family transcriptional regulator, temperature-dependent positive regulator of motility